MIPSYCDGCGNLLTEGWCSYHNAPISKVQHCNARTPDEDLEGTQEFSP